MTARLLIILLAMLGTGCDSVDSLDDGEYRYTAYDDAGAVIVTGVLQMTFSDDGRDGLDSRVEGTRDFDRRMAAEPLGPHAGRGPIEGAIDARGEVHISLNADWDDNNIYLSGRFTDERRRILHGTWVFVNFGGIATTGTFEARRP